MFGHNREDFWEIPESIIGKFSASIIGAGLATFSYPAKPKH